MPFPSRGDERSRPIALVTGGSTGIGAQFARVLAAEGYDLVLVARDLARLKDFAAGLAGDYPVTTDIVAVDLSTAGGRSAVEERLVTGLPDLLVNNAGVAIGSAFPDTPIDLLQHQVEVNVTAVLRLTHAALPGMIARRRGDIINVSSVAGFLSGYETCYAASKNWVTSFSEGLAGEVRGSGVRVMALCPGLTITESRQRAGTPSFLCLTAEKVVRQGLADLRAGKVLSVPSLRYKAFATVLDLAPRALARTIGRRITRRRL